MSGDTLPSAEGAPLRVLIVAEDPLVKAGLVSLVRSLEGFSPDGAAPGVVLDGLDGEGGGLGGKGPVSEEPFDVILEIGGRTLSRMQDLLSFLSETPPGSAFTARVVRGGETKELQIAVGERS